MEPGNRVKEFVQLKTIAGNLNNRFRAAFGINRTGPIGLTTFDQLRSV